MGSFGVPLFGVSDVLLRVLNESWSRGLFSLNSWSCVRVLVYPRVHRLIL